MTLRRAVALLLVCCAWMFPAPAAERYFPLDDITPGMVGLGRTVFEGETLDEFKVHILGVLRSTIAPRRDLILARLEGGPLAKTGVIAGMSGSPVYIDGRLAGAVSYSLGSFSTEPIAGITPIAEMLDMARMGDQRAARTPVPVPPYVTPDAGWAALRTHHSTSGYFASSAAEVRALSPAVDLSLATSLRRIATPLTMTGIDPALAGPLLDVLSRSGFVPVQSPGGVTATSRAPAAPLRPGDPVGVMLMSGDYNFGATGTVTDVSGSQVMAFGHPFFNLGPVRLPMTRAYVHTILPGLMSSTKIASTGDVIGTFTQDRSTVLAGTLGPGPDVIPVTLGLADAQGQRREIRISLIEDPFFTPLLGFVAVGSALSTFERDIGTNTYAVRGRLQVRGHPAITFDDVVTGDTASTFAASALSVPIAALLTNDREPVHIESVAIEITAAERTRSSSIERIWLDTAEVRPGRPVALKILLRPYRGPDEVRTVEIDVPPAAEGPLTIVVADGARLTQYEQRDGHGPSVPSSLAQLMAQIRTIKRNNRVYVRVFTRDAGATVGGAAMPGLPNSVLAVMEGDQAGSGTLSTGSTAIGSWEIPVDAAVTGMRVLSVTPVPFRRVP